jgi:cation diffusion facilitator family transporter
MHTEKLSDWFHDHVFHTAHAAAERSTRWVMWITACTMVLEIAAGWWFNSMALLADGWHMSSHAVAIGLTAFAYATSRRYARDPRFAFGTWKIEILAGFASAIFLLGVALMMCVGAMERMVSPQAIQYPQAMAIAVLGLGVNGVCAWILGQAHHHDGGHSHGQHHGHEHHHGHHLGHEPGHHHGAHQPDLNLKSAYLHVIADAATSVLAIAALLGGWLFGWSWLDPLMGLVGAVWVAVWAKGLLIETGKVLLDREMDHPVVDEIRQVVEEADPVAETRVTDLHVWRVGKQAYSCALTLVTHDRSLTPEVVRQRLSIHEEIVHTTIEVHHCPDDGHDATDDLRALA